MAFYNKNEEDFNINLAKLVEQNPCLYDYTSRDYNNTTMRTSAWQVIAEKLSQLDDFPVSVEDCKSRWKSLRGCITRDKKLCTKGGNIKKPYYLKDYLAFIKPFTRSATRTSRTTVKLICDDGADDDEGLPSEPKKQKINANEDLEETLATTSSQQIQEEHQYQTIPTAHPIQPKIKRYPVQMSNKKLENEYCAELNFFTSLIPDIKRMTPRQRSTFRIGVVSLIDQILYSNDQTQYVPNTEETNQTKTEDNNTTTVVNVNWNDSTL